ncbi:DinB family protein [Arenibacter palladensis]|uniref:DinB family protein n=1 Tax=Arenibacter palladensis TaxID=237373 RepID=UPI0026E3ABA5|nr:DinB family protein [Arenibacter palladensis]MDO6601404.1 DinB family protein [Arenibacter palladensis]
MSNEKVIVIPLVSFYKSVLPHNFALQRNPITLNCTIFSGNCKKYQPKIMSTLENAFDVTLQNRKRLYKFLKETPKEILLQIPQGFRNNIWWNIAHVVVTQQLLVYKFSGQPIRVSEALVEKFKKGTVPDGTATEEEIKQVADSLLPTVEWMQEDYGKGLFDGYTEYTTSANVTLSSVEDAIIFNVYHEGLHLGAILSLLKVVSKS